MKYNAEEFSRAGDKYLGRKYSEMDCQAFVERCMADVGYDRNLAGSNAWYRETMRNGWVGSPEQCLKEFGEIPKGALLFILKQDGKEPAKYRGDGIGNSSHIGIKTGRGAGAINSSSSRGCVCESTFKDKSINGGWNRVGLLKVFDYGKSINWILEHGGGTAPPGEDEKPMHGVVTAENGGTVKLRQKPSTGCAYYWDIKVGTELTILEKGDSWSKCTTGGLIGWMKNEFIKFDDGAENPDDDFNESDLADEPEAVVIRLDAKQLQAAWPALQTIFEQIIAQVGRG